MKKIVCLLLIICILCSFAGCSDIFGGSFYLFLVETGDDSADKEQIFAFVCENKEELRNAINNNDFSAFENRGFIKEISADETVVDFSCGGAGVGSGTSYVGFFYSPDNDMTAVWCAPSSADLLVACGDGFEWEESKGDNRYYTEMICDNFYYYEASF